MKIDGISIVTQEVIPPLLRKYKYFAAVQVLYVVDESGRHAANKKFRATYGETKEEAIEKMEQKVHKWIESQ